MTSKYTNAVWCSLRGCSRKATRRPQLAALGVLLPIAALALAPPDARAEVLRKIAEMRVSILGLSATVDPIAPVVPKNVASAVRVVVSAGADQLSADDVERFVGGPFDVHAELSGPGLKQTITLPQLAPGEEAPDDRLLLPLPALPVAGDYELSNIRIVASGQPVLDIDPSRIDLEVIDQILVTSVKTRPLTLDEIRQRGIVLDSDDYLGFEFTLGLKLESTPVNIRFPVVFDRKGAVVPQPIKPPAPPPRQTASLPSLPQMVPMLLELDEGDGSGPEVKLELPGSGEPVRIPSLLVIPGNVGFLKQFFSAMLFVSNGAPGGSALVVRDIKGTIRLPEPPGPGEDPPLSLPELPDGIQPETLPVRGLGPDGLPGTPDDLDALAPGEQAQAEFLIRGDAEGFHQIDFDIEAQLDGLPVSPVKIKGSATGGVLVRNPFFDMTFTAPSVVRAQEPFSLFVTVTNIGKATGNLVTVAFDAAAASGMLPLGDTSQLIPELRPGDSKTLEFRFESEKTGQVVASYLRFDAELGQTNVKGDLNFTVGLGERGVALSPDTLVLPTAVDALPQSVVLAAMRVLGQAWSVANAQTLPPTVLRTDRTVVTLKALALAEAGLRVRLGLDEAEAIRDLVRDFYGGEPLDPGFDQLLRETDAGSDFAAVLGAALTGPAAAEPGGLLAYEERAARILASGPDFVSFAVAGSGGSAFDLALVSGIGKRTQADLDVARIPGAIPLSLGSPGAAPVLGLLTDLAESRYTLELIQTGTAPLDLAVTVPRGDGSFVHGVLTGADLPTGRTARLVVDLADPDALRLERDLDGDGAFEPASSLDLTTSDLPREGPRLVSANVIGPETLDGATPFGTYAALLFDRVVSETDAAEVSRYAVPSNAVRAASRQLSGRLVFGVLEQPEGPYVPTTVTVKGLTDPRGVSRGDQTVPLGSRLVAPGAIVSGQVFSGDGQAITSSLVTYLNNVNLSCLGKVDQGISALAVDGNGRYELRYVRQDQCGFPFTLLTQDPATGAVRRVSSYVRGPGEHIVLDIALFAKGTVTGVVERVDQSRVPGALVQVVSGTDPQSFGSAETDGAGNFSIPGITVGPFTLRAAAGSGLGQAAGRIDRPGTPAFVKVVLDGDAASVHGTVRKVEGGITSRVPGIQVRYFQGSALLAVTETDGQGDYRFQNVPVGTFRVTAALNTRDSGSETRTASVGQDVQADIFIDIPPDSAFGTVRGTVFDHLGSPVPDVVVSIGSRGTLSADDGSTLGKGGFEITGVEVRPGQTQVVSARTRDGRRFGSRSFIFPGDPSPVVEGVAVTLSGLANARFIVKSSAGVPVGPGQEVLLQGLCLNPCGCAARTTGADSAVVFDDLGLGPVAAKAFKFGAGGVDVAGGTVVLGTPGETVTGTLQFPGTGTVRGLVLDAAQAQAGVPQPSFGAEVALGSRIYINDGEQRCGLFPGVSHRARTKQDGTFEFTGVNVGGISVTAVNPFNEDQSAGARGTLTVGQEQSFTLLFDDNAVHELKGTVFLPDGVTPAGSGVQVTADGPLPDVTVRTDADGAYRFAKDFLPQGSYELTARDPQTGLQGRQKVFLNKGAEAVHDLRLKGRGTVRVRVVDGADVAVANAAVTLRETEFPSRTLEGALEPANEGVVTLRNVFEGSFSVEAADPFGRGGRTSGVLPAADAVVDVTVRLTTTGTVDGVFSLPGGEPIPLGVVKLIAGGRTIGETTTEATGTDTPGRFVFDYVPAGEVRVEAQDPLTARTGFNVGTLETQNQTLTLNITAQSLGTVTGVVRANGIEQGLAKVDVVSGRYSASTFTDGGGVYSIDGVPEGLVVAAASLSGGFLKGTNSKLLSGDGNTVTIDVDLRNTGRVIGRVLPAVGTDPAPLSVVTIRVGGVGGGTLTRTTDENGDFVFDAVPAGRATLTVEVPGSIDTAKSTFEVPPLGEVDQQVRLNGVGSIAGTASGVPEPLKPFLVRYDVLVTGTGDFPYQLAVPVDSQDRFRLPAVLAGPFTATLRAYTDTLHFFGTASGDVLPALETPVPISIGDTGSVHGRVLYEDLSPAFGAEVVLVTSAGTFRRQAQADGDFDMIGVPTGLARVTVNDPLTGGVGLAEGVVVADGLLDLGTIQLDTSTVIVESVDPADGAIGVAIAQPVQIHFSDPIATYTSFVSVTNGPSGISIAKTLSPDGLTVTLTPNFGWPDSAQLTVTATTGVKDIFGRHLQQTFTSRFRTVDLSPPKVAAIDPADLAIQVAPDAALTVTFDEPILDVGLPGLVTLTGPAGAHAGTTTLLDPPTSVRFVPTAPLLINSLYEVSVNGATDPSGNVQTTAIKSRFKTLDTIPPQLHLTTPAPGDWSQTARPTIRVTLTDALSGIDASTALMLIDGLDVGVAPHPSQLTFAPPADLAEGEHALHVEIADRAGNPGTLDETIRIDTAAPEAAVLTGVVADEIVAGAVAVAATAQETGSGLDRIDVLADGVVRLALTPPTYGGDLDSTTLSEGPHVLSARGVDVAGNVGPAGAGIPVVVDNEPIEVTITSPDAGDVFGDSVLVTAVPSEPVERVEFQVESEPPIVDEDPPYEATLDLTPFEDASSPTITVRAFGSHGDSGSALLNVKVDHLAPDAPDAGQITAEASSDGETALVLGLPDAVEPNARVDAVNTRTSDVASATAAIDGSFAFRINAMVGDELSIVAVDVAGNASAATLILVEEQATQEGVPLHDLALWLRADAGTQLDPDGRVSAWADQSGRSNDATQANAAERPLWVADGAGGLPSLRFDGADDWVSFANRLLDARTIFWVLREADEAPAGVGRLLIGDSSTTHFFANDDNLVSTGAAAVVRNGQFLLNGDAVDPLATPRPRTWSLISLVTAGDAIVQRFGRDRGSIPGRWWGDLAELIIYDVPLNRTDIEAVESYLALKYGLFVPQVATPRILPDGGTFTGSTTVTISTTTQGAQIFYTLDGAEPSQSSTPFTAPFLVTATTTIKAKAFRPDLRASDTATATLVAAGDFSPGDVGGLRLWLRADADVVADAGNRVSAWGDQSDDHNDAVQGNAPEQPLLVTNAQNGLPVIRFDGQNDWLDFSQRLTTVRTVFWVLREDPVAAPGGRQLLGDSSTIHFWSTGSTLLSTGAAAVVLNGHLALNGVAVDGQQTPRPQQMSVVSLVTTGNAIASRFSRDRGSVDGHYWWGDLSELIIYDKPLSGAERSAVEEYLALKYRLFDAAVATPTATPSGGPFDGSVDVELSTTTPGAAIFYTTDGSEPTPASQAYAGAFTLTSTTTVKARGYRADLRDSAIATFGFVDDQELSPANVPGMLMWLAADAGVEIDSGSHVGLWRDLSTNAVDARQTNGAQTPVWIADAVNGRPAVRFDGQDDWLDFDDRLQTIRSAFWVIREDPAAVPGFGRQLLGDSSTIHFWTSGSTIFTTGASAAVLSGALWVNGVPVDGTATERPQSMSVVSLVTTGNAIASRFSKDRGSVDGHYWWGDLAELILYDRPITGAEHRAVEQYLALKYGLAPAAAAATPTASPNGGTLAGTTAVSLSTITPGATIAYTLDGSDPTPLSMLYTMPFDVSGTTTVKAVALRADLAPSPVATFTFLSSADAVPASVDGLELWWRADAGLGIDSGDHVYEWADQSLAGNDATQAASLALPRVIPNAVEGLPVVRFDGDSDYLEFDRLTDMRTIFWVLREDPAATPDAGRQLFGDSSTIHFWSTNSRLLSTSASAAVRNGALRLDGVTIDGTLVDRPQTTSLLSLVTTSSVIASRFSRDRSSLDGKLWWGDLAELIVYNQPLSDVDRRAVEEYLALRYGILLPPP